MKQNLAKIKWNLDSLIHTTSIILFERASLDEIKDDDVRKIQTYLVNARNEVVEALRLAKNIEDRDGKP